MDPLFIGIAVVVLIVVLFSLMILGKKNKEDIQEGVLPEPKPPLEALPPSYNDVPDYSAPDPSSYVSNDPVEYSPMASTSDAPEIVDTPDMPDPVASVDDSTDETLG